MEQGIQGSKKGRDTDIKVLYKNDVPEDTNCWTVIYSGGDRGVLGVKRGGGEKDPWRIFLS